MGQQARITSGYLKPITNKMPCGYAVAIRIIAAVILIGGILIGFATALYLIPISLISALLIDGVAEIVNYLHRLTSQQYELCNVTIDIQSQPQPQPQSRPQSKPQFDIRV